MLFLKPLKRGLGSEDYTDAWASTEGALTAEVSTRSLTEHACFLTIAKCGDGRFYLIFHENQNDLSEDVAEEIVLEQYVELFDGSGN
jgi:hypothetical protein